MGEKPQLQPYDFKAEQYDQIIIGTPVWASNFGSSASISIFNFSKICYRSIIVVKQLKGFRHGYY